MTMHLSDSTFQQVIEHLGDNAGESTGGQRRGPRLALRGRLTLLPCPEGLEGPIGPPLSVPVRDLSQGGVRFLLPRRLPLDTQFILLLAASQPLGTRETRPLAVLSVVSHWQPVSKDLFAIGGQFLEMLDTSAMPGELLSFEPRVVLPGMAANEPQGAAAAEMLRRAAC